MKGMDASGHCDNASPALTAGEGWHAWGQYLLLALVLAWPACSASAPVSKKADILLLQSGTATIYARAAEAFEQRLEQLCGGKKACPRARAAALPALPAALSDPPQLIVSLGHEAALQAFREAPDIPQLHALVSETEHQLHDRNGRGISALYLEQPLERQLAFIRFLLPDHRRIGILLSERTERLLPSLRRLTREADLDLRIIEVGSPREAGKRLHARGRDIDVLLALPDPVIYNRETLAGILLTAYQDRVPVIGFSQSMIRAGAIGGIYSSPRNIGIEAAQLALNILQDHRVIETHPSLLEVRVNRRVAGALHIRLPTDSEIQHWKEEQ